MNPVYQIPAGLNTIWTIGESLGGLKAAHYAHVALNSMVQGCNGGFMTLFFVNVLCIVIVMITMFFDGSHWLKKYHIYKYINMMRLDWRFAALTAQGCSVAKFMYLTN